MANLTATSDTRADTANATAWQKSGVCQSATTWIPEGAEFPAPNERSMKPIRSSGHTPAKIENMKTMANLTATSDTRADTANATAWQKSGVCQSATTWIPEDAEFPAPNERSMKPIRSLGHTPAKIENMKTVANLTATSDTRADTANATVWQKSGVCKSASTW